MDTTGDHSLPEPGSGEELTRRNVERVLALEDAEQDKTTFSDRLADAITAFSGSLLFVMITVVIVVAGSCLTSEHLKRSGSTRSLSPC